MSRDPAALARLARLAKLAEFARLADLAEQRRALAAAEAARREADAAAAREEAGFGEAPLRDAAEIEAAARWRDSVRRRLAALSAEISAVHAQESDALAAAAREMSRRRATEALLAQAEAGRARLEARRRERDGEPG